MSSRMESQTGMEEDNAKSDVSRVETGDGSQNSSSCGPTSPTHSPEHINQQGNVSDADIPARLPAVTTPVITLQACLDDTVSGVSISRNEMLDATLHINTEIDKMKREQVITKLAMLNLDTNGTKKILRKRLKRYYNHLRIAQYHLMLPYSERMQLDYLVVIDFEATCDEFNANVVQEIIEFPAVFVDVRNQTICSVFRSFCKPRVNPILTRFCTSLTGITQAQVDSAKDFTDVLREFENWLLMLNLGTDYKFAVVTDGYWDMSQLFKFQLELTSTDLPCWARQWVNIRKVYRAFYDSGYVNLQQMLSKSGMEFQGRPHCGLDDAINIAAIAIKLLHDGCIFTCNEYLCSYGSNIHYSGAPEPNKASPSSTLLAEVESHSDHDSKTVEHSDVLEVESHNDNDSKTVEHSDVLEVESHNDHDSKTVEHSDVLEVESHNDHDSKTVEHSDVLEVESHNDHDSKTVEHSDVLEVESHNDHDSKTVEHSDVLEVESHNDHDSKTVEHSDVLEQTCGILFMPGPFGYLPHDLSAIQNYQFKH